MKRTGVIICLMVMIMTMLAPASFATQNDNATAAKPGFKIVSSTPEDGTKGVSVENLSVKIYFDTDMIPTKNVRKANFKQFKLTDENGKNIPIKVYYSHKEKGLLMVLSDNVSKDVTIEGNTSYTLEIGSDLQAANGSKLGTKETITFKTLDQSKSTMVYMIMMGVMMVGMIFFTSRSAKKEAEKQKQASGKHETVNPYKEAKRTGKSVEEIVRKDEERKAKEAEARAKQREADAELEAALSRDSKEISYNKRVSAPRPISAAGSTYKIKLPEKTTSRKGTTNPKNQTGKQKNAARKNNKRR